MNDTTDWYDVAPFDGTDYRLLEAEESLPCRLFLLEGSEESLLIDAGTGVGDLRGTVEGLVDTDVRLLLTHTHWDHIGAIGQFDTVSAHPAEQNDDRVGLDTVHQEFTHRPAEFVGQHREAGGAFPDGFDPDSYGIATVEGVEDVRGGDTVDLGDRELEVIDTPGHSVGHVAVLDRERGVLHASDVVHMEKNLYIHFEHCDIEPYIDTFADVIDLRDSGAFDTMTTAHNPPMAGDELSVLDTLHDGLREIVAGERTPEVVDSGYGKANVYDVDGSEVYTKTHVGVE